MCVCMRMPVHVHVYISVGHGSQAEVRGQLAGASTLLPSCGSQGLKLSRLVADPLLDEPSLQALWCCFNGCSTFSK